MARVKFVEYEPESGEIIATAILEQREENILGFKNYIVCKKDDITEGMKVEIPTGTLVPEKIAKRFFEKIFNFEKEDGLFEPDATPLPEIPPEPPKIEPIVVVKSEPLPQQPVQAVGAIIPQPVAENIVPPAQEEKSVEIQTIYKANLHILWKIAHAIEFLLILSLFAILHIKGVL